MAKEFMDSINKKLDERLDKKLNFCFDIDDTITVWNNDRDYVNFEPIPKMVKVINDLFDLGHTIHLFTARGMTSCGPDKIELEIVPSLKENLKKIGLKYHKLITKKPYYDILIDDKAVQPKDFIDLIKIEVQNA